MVSCGIFAVVPFQKIPDPLESTDHFSFIPNATYLDMNYFLMKARLISPFSIDYSMLKSQWMPQILK